MDLRTRTEIEQTHRAGILEQDSVRLLVDTGVSDRVLRDGYRHEGIELGFGGECHRIDFEALVGAAVQLYPQTDVFIDLADARERDGGDVRFGVSDVSVVDVTSDSPGPAVHRRRRGAPTRCAATTSSAPTARAASAGTSFRSHQRRQYSREYPFAWFGILCEAPPSAPELIYNHSERGFALISQRTETLQRMYFQCDPDEDVDDWSDERIWEELQARVGANGCTLKEGPITSRTVLPFRSFVQEPMRHGTPGAGRRRGAHRPADGRQGAQPRARRRPRARRGARAGGRPAATSRRSTTTRRAPSAGSGRPSTSPTG